MRSSRILSFIFAGIFCGLSSAQAASVSGMVVDPNRAAIPRVPVRLLANSKEVAHTLTDEQGKFVFSQSCSDACFVEVQMPGFETRKVPVPLADSEIKLELAPVREQINVTANLTPTPTEQVGSSVTTISGKEIADRQALAAGDYLQTVPGATVNRSGGLGTVTSLFIRGGESNYTKVLVDGIPINQIGGVQDFGSIVSDNLNRIEVVRGPQSALFGTDAMTGVVQLFTERGASEDNRPHLRLDFDAGKYNTFHGGAGIGGQFKNFDYDGYWSKINTDNQGPDAEFNDTTGGFNVGLAVGKTQFRWLARGDSSHADTPGQTAFGPPDTGAFINKGEGYSGLSIKNQTTDAWDQRMVYTYERARLVSKDTIVDPPFTPVFGGISAPFPSFDFPSDFLNDTRRQHLDYQSNVVAGAGDRSYGQNIFTVAFSWDRETGHVGEVHKMRDNFGGTFQHQLVIGRLVLSNGVRVENNGSFGQTVVPRSSVAFLLRRGGEVFGASKLKFNFGLGIKEPDFTQSFSPDPEFQGNPNLRPERSRSFDFGIEQRLLNDHAKVEVNWFDNRFRDKIEFVSLPPTPTEPFPGTFANITKSKANGLEFIVEAAPVRNVHLTAGYTYLNNENLLRRPRHSGSLGLVWDWRKLTFSSTTVYVGRRPDSDFLFLGLTSSSPYSKWDVAAAYRITRQVSFTSAFENALDHRYMESLGFPALRATYRSGLRVRF